ncbi:MAG: hypothetical protein ACO331_14770 [Prochlorothrix sp.]
MKAHLDYGSIFQVKTIALVLGVGGGLLLAGSQGTRLFQEWQVRRQEQALLTQIQALEASKAYEQCRSQGATVDPTAKIYPEALTVVQSCFLKDAQQQADRGAWAETLAILVDFPTQGDRYPEAKSLMQTGMSALITEAEGILAQGDVEAAIALLQAVPTQVPGAEAVTQLTQDWQITWSQNAALKASAEQSLERGRWLEAKQTLDKVSNHPYWQADIKPLMTQAQAGIDRVMAQERAAKRAAIQRQQQQAQAQQAQAQQQPQLSQFEQRLQSVYDTYVDQGMEEGEAWETSCATLGGTVVDRGPESVCQS